MQLSFRALLASRSLACLAWGAGVLGSMACSSADSVAPPSNEAGSDAATLGSDAGTATPHDATGAIDDDGTARDVVEAGGDSGITPDGGPVGCNGQTLPGSGICSARMPATLTIIGPTYSAVGPTITYGAAPDLWVVDSFSGPGQQPPTVTPSASALSISAALTRPASGPGWAGVGVSIDGPQCVEESNYARGVLFDLSGDLGGCALYLDAVNSQNEPSAGDPCHGACTDDAGACIAPSFQITDMGMLTVPNMSFAGGTSGPNSTKLIGFRWRLQTPDSDASTGCTANITIANVALLGL
jgi:hypothetical protein